MLAKRKNTKIKFYILAVIILLIFLHLVGLLQPAEGFLLRHLSNLQNTSYTFLTRLKYSFINYQESQAYKSENEELKSEINQLVYANSQLRIYEQENQRLRSLLNFYQENEHEYLMAKVIAKDFHKDNTLIINKGKKDGLDLGYAAVVDQGMIVGKVIDVRDYLATILLLTDNQSQLAVSTLNTNKTTGLAQGEYGLSIKVELIPQNIELVEKDIIITSGLEANVPRGLVLGEVNRILSNPNDLFKSVTISPLVDYEEITFLSIVLPKNKIND